MMDSPVSTIFDEITDFLASSPSSSEIVAYKPSAHLDHRLHELLDKQSDDDLSDSETSELNQFIEMNHFLTVLKAKTRLKLAGRS